MSFLIGFILNETPNCTEMLVGSSEANLSINGFLEVSVTALYFRDFECEGASFIRYLTMKPSLPNLTRTP